MNVATYLTLSVLLVAYVYAQEGSGKPVKYAPQYCHQFHFNCEKSAGHVCCRFPLPPKDHVEGENTSNRGHQVRIRPIRLPAKKNEEEQNGQAQNEEQQKQNPVNQSANQRKQALVKQQQASASKKDQPQEEEQVPVAPPVKPLTFKERFSAMQGSRKRPPLCIRGMVNCKATPAHRCCQMNDEEKPQEEAQEQEVQQETEKDPQSGQTDQTPSSGSESINKDQVNQAQVSQQQVDQQNSQEPIVLKPVVLPVDLEPVVQAPVVQAPVVQAPVVQAPVVQEPFVQEPVNQEPVIQEPVNQDSNQESSGSQERETFFTLPPLTATVTTTTEPPSEFVSGLDVNPNLDIGKRSTGHSGQSSGWVSSVEAIQLPREEQSQPYVDPVLDQPNVKVIHQKIPAECFSHTVNCIVNPQHVCCLYM